MISLDQKDLTKAREKRLVRAVRVAAEIKAARRLYDAGASPEIAAQKSSARDALERNQLEAMVAFNLAKDEADFEDQEHDAALHSWLDRPYEELDPEESAMRRNLDPRFIQPAAQVAARDRRVARSRAKGAKKAVQSIVDGTQGSAKPRHPSLTLLFDRYSVL